MIRRILSRLGQWVDESSVTHYQTVCYIAFIVAGAQTVVWNPPTAVARAMGEAADTVWAVMLIVCPLLTLAGTWLMRRDVAGLWLRLAGDDDENAHTDRRRRRPRERRIRTPSRLYYRSDITERCCCAADIAREP